jgi:cobyrinic acid a,c-diamide synthase
MPHVYLAATRKSSGKTTLSIGLTRALRERGHRVQPFKKGPDYIDPLWLSQAAGCSCLNLDYHTTPAQEIRDAFARALAHADLGLIEGNVGLFDSIDLQGANSNAELAKHLGAPVVLVVDVQGMTRGVAPLLLGYQAFDPALRYAGVVLNKVGGGRHGDNLRRVVEHYTDLPVLGMVPRLSALAIEERHLGLMPSNEADAAEQTVQRIADIIAAHVDVDAIAQIAFAAPAPPMPSAPRPRWPVAKGELVRIGIARDDAFGFYYPDDLCALEEGGAELVPFSPVADAQLPEVEALLIGGGFPEMRMEALDANTSMRAAVADFILSGKPAYAECGGLMYLAKHLHWEGRVARMCGVLNADVAMHHRPQGRGYVRLAETAAFPWPGSDAGHDVIRAHEFHHSAVVATDPNWVYGYKVLRGRGIDGEHDGVVQGNLLASYAHLRAVGGVAWTNRFLAHVRALR